MYIDLKYASRRKLPVGCAFVAGMVHSTGIEMILAWNEVTGRFIGIGKQGAYDLDQQETAEALQAAQDKEKAEQAQRVSLEPAEVLQKLPGYDPSRYLSCKVPDWAADIFRKLGGGNLTEGFRRAARMIEQHNK